MLTYNVILELYQYLIKAQDWHLSPESASILPRESVASQGDRMNTKELNAFTARWLMALKTAQADGDHKTACIIVNALAKAHGIPASYPPRSATSGLVCNWRGT